jgi:threonine aldolase
MKMAERMRLIAESPYALMPMDRYGAGGFVTKFEGGVAELLGKEAAVFMPSGTMAQQIALRIWSDRAGISRVAFHPTCHMEIHEQNAYAKLHGLEAVLVGPVDGLMSLSDLSAVEVKLSALLLELPQREIGGQLPSWDELVSLVSWARQKGVRVHLDGARLWECQPWFGRSYAEICGLFDSVYVSCYKILNGLPGAVLAGTADFVAEARIWLRRHGGNLQTQAPAAISAKLGMEKHLPRIEEYCDRARAFALAFGAIEGVRVVPEVPPTNMMHVHLTGDRDVLWDSILRVADETKVLVSSHLVAKGEGVCGFEMSIGEASLDVSPDEAGALMRRVLGLA